jgi:sugar O-acyltransferase (sialic acid O-acetyltransferase NeuD family)
MTARMAVFGAGGAASEVGWIASLAYPELEIVHVVDANFAESAPAVGRAVITLDEFARWNEPKRVCIAIGEPQIRSNCFERLSSIGAHFVTVQHPSAIVAPTATVGEGCIIAPGAIVIGNAVLGAHVYVNVGATISHDSVIGDFSTLCPGVHVSGHVRVGHHAFLGTGVSTVNGSRGHPLNIGHFAVVGAGACVTSDVSEHQCVVGVPAKPLGR